jgi:uncharacterized protein YigA (DUF484 family)
VGTEAPGPTRTAAIVDRVRQELLGQEQHYWGSLDQAARTEVIANAVTLVGSYAESLSHRAGFVSVHRMIIMITAHALGQLGFDPGMFESLHTFSEDIDKLVRS